MADYTKMSINDLRSLIADAQRALDEKIEARKAELQRELSELMGKSARPTKTTKQTVKALYRSPDGKHSYSGRGAIPKWAVELGIKDRAGLEKYKIKE